MLIRDRIRRFFHRIRRAEPDWFNTGSDRWVEVKRHDEWIVEQRQTLWIDMNSGSREWRNSVVLHPNRPIKRLRSLYPTSSIGFDK